MFVLVFFVIILNYIDCVVFGVMQLILVEKMSWMVMDYVNINFWFQVGYVIGFIFQGCFIDKVGVKCVFFFVVLFWSLVIGVYGLVILVVGFMVCCFIFGLIEVVNYLVCVKIICLWFFVGEWVVVIGIFNVGINVGVMVILVLLLLIFGVWGWQVVFFCMLVLGLVWLVFWWCNYYNFEEYLWVKQSELEYIQQQELFVICVFFLQIFCCCGIWVFVLVYLIIVLVFWFYFYWLLLFFNQQYGLGISVMQMGILLILIWLIVDFGSVGGGIFLFWLIGCGMLVICVCLLLMLLFVCIIVGVVFVVNVSGLWIVVLVIVLVVGVYQVWMVNIWSLVMDYMFKYLMSMVFGFGGMCVVLGGMFMIQIVGGVLIVMNNNYVVFFIMILVMYFIVLIWLYFMVLCWIEV